VVSGVIDKNTTFKIREICKGPNFSFTTLANNQTAKRYAAKLVVSARHLQSMTASERACVLPEQILTNELADTVCKAAVEAIFLATGIRRRCEDIELLVSEPGVPEQNMHLDGTHERFISVLINCSNETTPPTQFPMYDFNPSDLFGSTPTTDWVTIPRSTYTWVETDAIVYYPCRVHAAPTCRHFRVLLYLEAHPPNDEPWHGDNLLEQDFFNELAIEHRKALSDNAKLESEWLKLGPTNALWYKGPYDNVRVLSKTQLKGADITRGIPGVNGIWCYACGHIISINDISIAKHLRDIHFGTLSELKIADSHTKNGWGMCRKNEHDDGAERDDQGDPANDRSNEGDDAGADDQGDPENDRSNEGANDQSNEGADAGADDQGDPANNRSNEGANDRSNEGADAGADDQGDPANDRSNEGANDRSNEGEDADRAANAGDRAGDRANAGWLDGLSPPTMLSMPLFNELYTITKPAWQ
jgi:hypothetical protein